MDSQSYTQPNNAIVSTDQNVNRWAKWIHFSLFVAYFVPLIGLALPIVLWQNKKDRYPFIDVHGKIVANWMINLLLYVSLFVIIMHNTGGARGTRGAIILSCVILALVAIIYPIIGGLKASRGEVWEYPMSVKFFR